jgi:hypothetical protein
MISMVDVPEKSGLRNGLRGLLALSNLSSDYFFVKSSNILKASFSSL